MRVLVTGGAGYVGSHTAKALAKAGVEPVTLDDLSRGHRWAVQWGPLIEGDIGDAALLETTIRSFQIEAVLHFAAVAYVGESMEQPGWYFKNNVAKTLSMLETMRLMSVRHIVFSSSCATYGIPVKVPICERDRQAPMNPYGESKRMVERILDWYGQCHGLGWVALRYFNAAGADPEGELGEDHRPETHLIPRAIAAALGTSPHLDVFGDNYETADGTAVRDYVHVTDLAEAHVHALRYLTDGNPNDAFNLGTGRGHSVLEVVEAVERVIGRSVPVQIGPRRPGDPPILLADGSKAASNFGWKPGLSDIGSICSTAAHWYARRVSRTDEHQENHSGNTKRYGL
jgi:UDP-arabinose 4-epimerase